VKRLFTAGGNSGAANQLSVQLFDKAGRVVHAKRKYTIRGPEEFAGFTDIDDVTPGDYTLKLSLEFFEGADKIVDEFESPLLVSPGSNVPQVRMLGVVPRCVLARLRGLLFDTNKAFLLPSAIPDLKQIRQLYEQNDPSKLLIVGHTDTTATPSINDPLSLERAKSMLAYLGDNVDQWFEFYATSVPEARRWGTIEDRHMLTTLQRSSGVPTDADFEAFKAANGVIEDGVGDNTRKALIQKYMDLDGATLNPANITAQVHGCGENFPLDDSAEELDTAPANNKEDALDRRVELFFFDVDFGIVPKPPGDNSSKGSTQYPAWRKQADLIKDNSRPKRVFIQFVDDENEHLGELDYTLVTNDGFTVSRFTSDATVNELLPPSATSAILEIDGQRIEIDISEA
jgi:OmpA family